MFIGGTNRYKLMTAYVVASVTYVKIRIWLSSKCSYNSSIWSQLILIMAWRLNSFFGCGRLETGGKVIGGIQLTWSLIAIFIAILGILASIVVINDPETLPQDVSASKSGYPCLY